MTTMDSNDPLSQDYTERLNLTIPDLDFDDMQGSSHTLLKRAHSLESIKLTFN
jgi:hypothetical protein